MPIFRIRENFSPQYHSLNTIPDFEKKWKGILLNRFNEETEYVLDSAKLSTEVSCFTLRRSGEEFHLETSYLIGLDYIKEGLPIMVEPKFSYNRKDYSIDFYSILFNSLAFVKSNEVISDLYEIKFESKPIEIEQKEDFLTPILVIQFITILKKICQSGLQKGYYRVEENLSGKIKGKILVKETLKKNHFRSEYSKTVCNYQEYGINTAENQFLKFAFQFCLNYLSKFKSLDLFQNIESTIGLIRSAFQPVDLKSFRRSTNIKKNPLFPSYEQACALANLILKRNAFNITNTTQNKVKTYPYWIDMSKLFELHVLKLLRENIKTDIIYQKKYGMGRIPDIVINNEAIKAVIDVKYKDYSSKTVDIEDIRQVAAYSRMKGIFKELNLKAADVLDAIIIYPKIESDNKTLDKNVLASKTELNDYHNIFELEVDIPIIKPN